jgi:hypothetical protein
VRKLTTTILLLSYLLTLLNTGAVAQSINQRNESVTTGFLYSTDIHWAVDWSYPSPFNPSTSGMSTWCKAFGYFLVGGAIIPANDVQIAQYTFPGTFQGSKEFDWNGYIPLYFENQRPMGATHLTWKVRIHSLITYGSPSQFLTDDWTSASWTVHTY